MMNFFKKYKFEIFFFLFQILIAFRIVLEMGRDLDFIVFIHQSLWFNFVMLWFLLFFYKFLKIDLERLTILFLGGFLTFIPVFYINFILKKHIHLDYYVIKSFNQTLFDLLTMLGFHKFNYPMFPELVLLFTLSFIIAIFLSKKLLKSFLNTLFAFYGSFLIAGISWFSLQKNQPALVVLKSFLKPQRFYAIKWFIFVVILFSVVFINDTFFIFKEKKLFIKYISSSFFLFLLEFFLNKTSVLDTLILFLFSFSLVYMIFSFVKFEKKLRILVSIYLVYGISLLF